ncbi:sensor domain-containing diguanylate cyclase [Thermodesulfovibrionales bacterium]|nr:sensor domain-containing diguanylate cyclase [Thermodesulfovibrionales bacterium]
MPASTNNITEISELGFSDNIISINVFPLSYSKSNYEAVMIYNSVVPRQESYSILEFCKLISLVICSLVRQNTRDKYIDALLRLKNSVMKLLIQPRDPNSIYDSIINAAAELLNAEKASLMLLEADNLRIKAVRGINKWLVQDIRIKMGECIAGKVLQEGKTLHVKEVKKELPYIKLKSHYKTGSFVCMPLKFGSETIGILNITDKAAGEEFTEMDLNLLNHLASNISMVLKMSNYCWLAKQMKELSITDHLTGLFNRRYLQERFSEEIYRSERHNLTFSLEMFDIDNFKLFNDTEGHIAGDDILKGIASVASKSLRINDIIARFGGEEFVIIMPQTDKEKRGIWSCRKDKKKYKRVFCP